MPEELDGQIWPEREWFFHFKVLEADKSNSLSWKVISASSALEANKLLEKHIAVNYPGNKGQCVLAMNRV